MGSKTKYTRERLAPIVASSTSLSDVMRKLGLPVNGGNHRMISARVRLAELDTSHFGGKVRIRIEQVPREELAELVASASSLAEVLTRLELPTEGRAHHELKRRLGDLTIDTSHMTGQAWSRGKTKRTHPSLKQMSSRTRTPDEDVFIENSPLLTARLLRERVLEQGWPYACAECGISDWRGKSLTLELDHINGINNDNRLVNLRFLCPNCHSQTETFCNRRRPQPSTAGEPRAQYSCYTSRTRERGATWYPR